MSSWRGRSIGDLSRRMTKQYRQRIKDRFAKRQEKRVVQKAAARVCQFVGLQGEVPKGDEGKAERLRHYYHHFVEPDVGVLFLYVHRNLAFVHTCLAQQR